MQDGGNIVVMSGLLIGLAYGATAIGAKWQRRLRLPHATGDIEVILQILSHAGKVLDYFNSMPFQFHLIADAGLHKYLGSMNRTE